MTGRALFIGVSEYESDGFVSYPTVGRSARALQQLFDASSLWDESRLLENPVRDQVMDEVRSTLDQCEPSDVVLIYFCGHGELPRWRDHPSELHLALSDSGFKDESSQLPLHHLYDALRKCLASAKILVLDCCKCGDVPVLSNEDVEGDHAPDERTWVLKALRCGELYAAAGSADDEYTAFSGALIKVLGGGIPDGGDLLDVDDVFEELLRSLRRGGFPRPEMIRRGQGSLRMLENADPAAEQRLHEVLAEASSADLARMWLGMPGIPAHMIEQHLRTRLRGGENALELAHRMHDRDEDSPRLRDFAKLLVSHLEDIAGGTARLLTSSGCRKCANFAGTVLEQAAALSADRLAAFHAALVADEPEIIGLEVDLAGMVAGDRLAALVGEPEEQVAEGADRMLRVFASIRPIADLRELLSALYARGEHFAVETVLANAALARPPAEAAEFARLLRGTAEWEIGKLVVRKRLPQDLAAFVAAFGPEADSVMRRLLAVAVEDSSPGDLIRVARALRSRGFTDAPVATVERALHHGSPPADVCALLDGLAGCAAEQRDAIEGLFRAHLREASVEELEFFLRRKDFLGRSDDLVHDVVGSREIEDVIALHRHAADEDAELAWSITRAVARTHKAQHLMRFARERPDHAENLFHEVGRLRDGDVIGLLLKMWHDGDSGPHIRQTGLSDGWFASVVPPEVLLDARMFLLDLDGKKGKLMDDVLRKVLQEYPHKLAPSQIASLLVALPAPSSRKLSETTRPLVRKLDDEFGEPPVTLTYLAQLVKAVSEYRLPVTEDLAARIDEAVYNRDDAALHRQYAAELGKNGVPDRQHEFNRRIHS